MYLSTYEDLRRFIIANHTLQSLVKPSYTSFFQSAIVPICAFTIRNSKADTEYRGSYFDLGYLGNASEQSPRFLAGLHGDEQYCAKKRRASDFQNIPGCPVAFQFPEEVFSLFQRGELIKSHTQSLVKGIFTGDNNRFLRLWFEISGDDFSSGEWRKYNKAGGYRKWYGVALHAIDWRKNGSDLKSFKGAGLSSASNFGKSHLVWGKLTSGDPSFRFDADETWFDDASPAVIEPENYDLCLALLNSNSARMFLKTFNPTMNLQPGDVSKVPYPLVREKDRVSIVSRTLVDVSKSDWDAYETSWDFSSLPLLSSDHRAERLADAYANLRTLWQGMTDEMQRLEEENNRIFIDAYGLQDELTPEVPIQEITLTCNPAYRYGVKGSEEDREARLREDTVAEFLHYAVGCMFGRYSLDAPGLILANQGEGIEEYLAALQKQGVPEPSFAPDRDNVIPVLDADWFADDIVIRARDFVRMTFGEAKFRENLAFIEKALGKDLRRWFTKDFFDYHVRRYKKRPIYWMFSSPKGSFNALIYMHRYRPDTVSVVLNQYVREFIHKLEVERARLEKLADDPAATPAQQTKAQKETATVIKQIAELTEWEREVVYPMAQQKIAIDLDDGVKRNYPLFAGALKPIKGLEAADD